MKSNWTKKILSEVCLKIGSGQTPRGGKESYKGGDFAFIRSQNVHNNGFTKNGLVYINNSQADQLSNVVVSSKDVFINITGDSVARCCMVPEEILPARVNQHVAILRADNKSLDGGFLRYFLISPKNQRLLLSLSSGGATRKALTKVMLESFEIVLPSLLEQKAISKILGTLDEKIKLNKQSNETLEGVAKAIFKSWFIDFDPVKAKVEGVPTGLPDQISDLFPDSFEDSELGQIPKGFSTGEIQDLCEWVSSGGTPSRSNKVFWTNGNISWFKTGELNDSLLFDSSEKINELAIKNSSCKLWEKGTILFAIYASPTVGKLGVLTKSGTCNQAAAGLKAKEEIGTAYLRRCLFFSRKNLQNIAVGAAQQNINVQILKKYQIVIPNENLSSLYSNLISTLDLKQESLLKEILYLENLRDSLLPKLISGDINIEDAEKIIEEADI